MPAEDGGEESGRDEQARAVSHQVRMVLTMTFLVFIGQSTINPVLAPLTRSLGLHEWQAGLILSSSALMMVLTSRYWGRQSQRIGRKPVLVGSALAATISLLMFAGVAQLGMSGIVTGLALFLLLLLTRGALFGTSLSAVFPTAQAFVADVTVTELERVRGMAGLGSVQGLAMISGSVVGGLLASISLIASIALVPIAPLLAAIVGAFFLKREQPSALVLRPSKVSVSDPRVWPFLVVSLGVFTVFSMIQVTTGFVIQDRYTFAEQILPLVIGGTLLGAGVGMLFAQGVIVPLSRWRAPTLMRVGTVVVVLAFIIAVFPVPLPLLILAIFLVGLGTGIAIPGALSAPTLLVTREEQGGLAGTLSATNGIAWMVTPLLATVMYGLSPLLPMLVSLLLIVGVAIFTFIHQRLRS